MKILAFWHHDRFIFHDRIEIQPVISTRPTDWMTQDLDKVFADLGLSQYLDTFVDQGFDVWDTILDIQESDLLVVTRVQMP